MSKNSTVATTRLSPDAKHALAEEADELEVTESMLIRRIVTEHLRKRWEIEDSKVA